MSEKWTVKNCGNSEHGPDMFCHRVMDATGKVLLQSVDRATADTFASVPVLRAQVRTLEADNAALFACSDRVHLLAQHDESCRMLVGDDLAMCNCALGDWQEIQRRMSRGDHPGAALLAEMEGIKPVAHLLRQYQRSDETTLLATLERLLDERSRIAHMVEPAQLDSLRARVAELEARYAKSEKERGLAILAKQEHERAAGIARDAALEEAEQRILDCEGCAFPWSNALEQVRALKSQPARRFVDAERVEHAAAVVRSFLDRVTVELGLTDDDGAVAGSTSDLNAADIAGVHRVLADMTSSAPSRRFVDVEEVRKVLRDLLNTDRDELPRDALEVSDGTLKEAARRLGLTLDGETT